MKLAKMFLVLACAMGTFSVLATNGETVQTTTNATHAACHRKPARHGGGSNVCHHHHRKAPATTETGRPQ